MATLGCRWVGLGPPDLVQDDVAAVPGLGLPAGPPLPSPGCRRAAPGIQPRGCHGVACEDGVLGRLCLAFCERFARIAGCVGTWRSLGARTVRDREAAGSNPVVPTIFELEGSSAAAGDFFCFGLPEVLPPHAISPGAYACSVTQALAEASGPARRCPPLSAIPLRRRLLGRFSRFGRTGLP